MLYEKHIICLLENIILKTEPRVQAFIWFRDRYISRGKKKRSINIILWKAIRNSFLLIKKCIFLKKKK